VADANDIDETARCPQAFEDTRDRPALIVV
jgi:hypothetical protein